jgi:beta-N-acetylhexosaminidase
LKDNFHNTIYNGIKALLLFSIFSLSFSARSQDAEFWHEYQLKNMSLDQKIGQLFMVAAYSNKDAAHVAEIEKLIRDYHIGGLIFFQNDPLKQAYLTNYYQSISGTPLMIGIDGEWGLAMRLQNTQRFPYAMTLGALQNDSLVFKTGAAIARQCRRLGIHVNFAPDVDINNNPDNPIIGFRAFGDNKYRVARLGAAYSNGMLSENVLACAKHFPGHGDVHTDSHLDLPVVDKSLSQLDSGELYPFTYLIQQGVPSIMVAHIHFPQLDKRPNRSASLSKYMIDTLLRQRMGFDGLVFTDALNMKGVSKYYSNGQADLEAFLAGNDVLLFSEDVPAAIALIRQAVLDGRISMQELDKRVKRILKGKQFVGLDKYMPIDLDRLTIDLAGRENAGLLQDIADNAVTLAQAGQQGLPVKAAAQTLALTIGDIKNSAWKLTLESHGIRHFLTAEKNLSPEKRNALVKKLGAYKTIIISLHQPKVWAQSTAGYTANDFALIKQIASKKNVILVGFCNPYALQAAGENITVIAGYEDLDFYHRAAANIIFGKQDARGKLPVELVFGKSIESLERRKFTPDRSGVDTLMLKRIDGIVAELIKKKGAPGCRVYVMKDGKEILDKSYGYLNYNKAKAVNDSSIYDIASITKIAATTLAIMKLYDEGRLDLSKTLGDYLPQARGTNKENLVISDILQHRAGLTAWIPFYKETLPYVDSIYCKKEDSAFCIKVADNFFMLKANRDTIYKRVFSSALESRTYRYSDLSMILMQLVVEQVSGKPLDRYLNEEFYQPMGLSHIGYNPWKRMTVNNIAPTQEDRLFRQQEICGYVHDPGAAMLGGVSGHAGIFSTAHDLAMLMQMLNDSGRYNGRQYIKASTITKFTSYQRTDSRRGLGFDKPDFSGRTSPASKLGSRLMFGHTGFTGTCTWADPKYNLVFVFLSNRICPDEENKELISGNYRTRIQDVIYEAIGL